MWEGRDFTLRFRRPLSKNRTEITYMQIAYFQEKELPPGNPIKKQKT